MDGDDGRQPLPRADRAVASDTASVTGAPTDDNEAVVDEDGSKQNLGSDAWTIFKCWQRYAQTYSHENKPDLLILFARHSSGVPRTVAIQDEEFDMMRRTFDD